MLFILFRCVNEFFDAALLSPVCRAAGSVRGPLLQQLAATVHRVLRRAHSGAHRSQKRRGALAPRRVQRAHLRRSSDGCHRCYAFPNHDADLLDHTRLDVLLSAARKDVEEWASLTLQLIENAFNNAENTYLSNLWPTPPASPRLDTVLLLLHYNDTTTAWSLTITD